MMHVIQIQIFKFKKFNHPTRGSFVVVIVSILITWVIPFGRWLLCLHQLALVTCVCVSEDSAKVVLFSGLLCNQPKGAVCPNRQVYFVTSQREQCAQIFRFTL